MPDLGAGRTISYMPDVDAARMADPPPEPDEELRGGHSAGVVRPGEPGTGWVHSRGISA